MVWVAAWIGLFVICWRMPPARVAEVQGSFGLCPGEVATRLQGRWPIDLGSWWRRVIVPLVSYPFLHVGTAHVGLNAWFFWVFGGRLETGAGSGRFLVFVVAAGATAGLVDVLYAGGGGTIAVGSSGVVAATMAAFACFHLRSRVRVCVPVVVVPVAVELPAMVLMAAWLATQFRPILQFLAVGTAEPLAWPGSLGGLVAGIVLAPLLAWGRSTGRRGAPRK
jgi:membrane associated rhomboid family serine protease